MNKVITWVVGAFIFVGAFWVLAMKTLRSHAKAAVAKRDLDEMKGVLDDVATAERIRANTTRLTDDIVSKRLRDGYSRDALPDNDTDLDINRR